MYPNFKAICASLPVLAESRAGAYLVKTITFFRWKKTSMVLDSFNAVSGNGSLKEYSILGIFALENRNKSSVNHIYTK